MSPAQQVKRIGILTSGGDAPGMNAAIRAVVRCAIAQGYETVGIEHGFSGLIDGQVRALDARSVGGIIDRGGTILGTSRCERLKSEAGCSAAVDRILSLGVRALIVVGGNGTHAGAQRLIQSGGRIIAIASTIDNDLPTCDTSIGAMTALNTALDAIDRLRVTASAHRRVFLVEVMGRNSGHLALSVAVAGGAESVVVPEVATDAEGIAAQIVAAYERGKSHAIVVVAEGAQYNAESLASYFTTHRARLGFELRITKLGHIQRGGTPCVYDRVIASELGAAAVAHALAGESGLTLGIVHGRVACAPLSAALSASKPLDRELFELAQTLAQ